MSSRHFSDYGLPARLLTLTLFLMLAPAILIFRLWHEQLRLGEAHRRSISRQSIRRIRLAPIRGRIFSADGVALADNQPVYDLMFHLHEMRRGSRRGRRNTVDLILDQIVLTAKIIGRKNTITREQLERHIRVYPALPFRGFTNLTPAERARISETMPAIPGLEIAIHVRRVYPQNDVGPHLIGFVGHRDPATEQQRKNYSYFLPELVGRAGLERVYDPQLRGKGGTRLVRVDCRGFFHDELANFWLSRHGNDLHLTINSRAQRIAQNLLRGKKGALVLMNCHSGALLALVSSPSYDLNHLSGKRYAELAGDTKQRPLVNRALTAGYMPGSIIKPLIALCLLKNGTVTPTETINCPGGVEVGNAWISCANHAGHGPVNLTTALEVSCNSYFITAGLRCGIDRISPFLATAGIGQNPGLKLGGGAGILPSGAQPGWTTFDTALISIGQGKISVSPLQAAMYVAAIANGGRLMRPYLIQSIRDPKGHYLQVAKREIIDNLPISPSALAIVRRGMEQVVHGKHATAPAARTKRIYLAGKTGTAEVGEGSKKRKNTWFVCFGPVSSPRYAMAIIVENGVSGGKTAAPIARRFFESFLLKKI